MNFDEVFNSSNSILDSRGHPMAYETVLIEEMTGQVVEEFLNTFKVKFNFYPFPIYVLKEHVKKTQETCNFEKLMYQEIKKRLESCIGKPYLWGGNHVNLTSSFIHKFSISKKSKRELRAIKLEGLDCSGLLFYATNFNTPRNTSQLQYFGEPVLDVEDIQPLDLIMTQGHVQIVLDKTHIIQSRQNRGVYVSKIKDEISRLLKKRNLKANVSGLNDFSIRRFQF